MNADKTDKISQKITPRQSRTPNDRKSDSKDPMRTSSQQDRKGHKD